MTGGGDVFMSAPYDARCGTRAWYPWQHYTPFQPLLGFDAQMAGFAAHTIGQNKRVFCLAAPEILSAAMLRSSVVSTDAAKHEREHITHFRFGPVRAPRLLKGAANVAIIAEIQKPTISLGQHPFASGKVVPNDIALICVYQPCGDVFTRVNGQAATATNLPNHLSFIDLPPETNIAVVLPPHANLAIGMPALVQSCVDFDISAWQRSKSKVMAHEGADDSISQLLASCRRPIILVPWNLAHSCSPLPSLFEKAQLLAIQDRFPVTLLVLPYNDVPWGLPDLVNTIAACSRLRSAAPNHPHVLLFGRGKTLDAGLALAALCDSAWVEQSDPECEWTANRLRRIGMRVTFIPDAPGENATLDSDFTSDQIEWRQRLSPFGRLAWRSETLSIRRLAQLAATVAATAGSQSQNQSNRELATAAPAAARDTTERPVIADA